MLLVCGDNVRHIPTDLVSIILILHLGNRHHFSVRWIDALKLEGNSFQREILLEIVLGHSRHSTLKLVISKADVKIVNPTICPVLKLKFGIIILSILINEATLDQV